MLRAYRQQVLEEDYETNWGSKLHQVKSAHAGPLPEAPGFLGTWRWRQPDPSETTEAWLERTVRQRAEVIAAAEDWLCIGQAVKVHVDPRVGGGDVAGSIGTVFQLCGPLSSDFVYVHFAATGREKTPRVRLLPPEILLPTE